MNSSCLIRNAHAVMTGAAGPAARSDAHDIRVTDGVIVEMGSGLAPLPGERVLDASACVVYPGWVNTHHHLFQSLLKGVPGGIDQTLGPWLQAVPFRFGPGVDERRLRLAARIGLVELMLSGCTTVADHHYLFYGDGVDDPAEVLFEEAGRLGLRFMLLRGGNTVERTLDPGKRRAPETLDTMVDAIGRTVSRFHQTGPRPMRQVALAPTTVNFSVLPEELRPLAREARRLGIRLHSHLSETVATQEQCLAVHGCSPVEFVARHEWLGSDVFFAHLVHLEDHERRLLAETGTGIAHCPQSNARLADGIAPAPELAALGAPVGLGVDGAASNEAADMISEAHACWLIHRALAGSRTRPRPQGRGEGGAGVVTAEQVLHWGTASGARMLGFEGVGTLEPGQAADLAVYELDQPRYFGMHDPAIAPIVCGGRPSLRWLLADGHVVVERDQIPGLDLAALRAEAREMVRDWTGAPAA